MLHHRLMRAGPSPEPRIAPAVQLFPDNAPSARAVPTRPQSRPGHLVYTNQPCPAFEMIARCLGPRYGNRDHAPPHAAGNVRSSARRVREYPMARPIGHFTVSLAMRVDSEDDMSLLSVRRGSGRACEMVCSLGVSSAANFESPTSASAPPPLSFPLPPKPWDRGRSFSAIPFAADKAFWPP